MGQRMLMDTTGWYHSRLGCRLIGVWLPIIILASGLLAALVPPAEAIACAARSVTSAAEACRSDPGGRRNPFRPVISSPVVGSLPRLDLCPPLQDFPLADLTLVGVLRGVSGAKGLVKAPNGRSH